MISRLITCLATLLIVVGGVQAQTQSQPFASVDQAVKTQRGGWAGDKSHLSAVFAAERRALGDKFEVELLKWLGKDVDKHYWTAYFLESDDYLHGNKRLPQLSLLVMEQGLSLVRDEVDRDAKGYVVTLSIIAATLSDELGFASLAVSYKDKAERLLKNNPHLSVHVPAMYDADRRQYDNIRSTVTRPVVVADSNSAPPQTRVYGGVLNGRAVRLVRPTLPPDAQKARASGKVEVNIVFDEEGKVIWARAISGHPLLRAVCEDAARQTTFPPTKIEGHLVKVRGVLIYNFGSSDVAGPNRKAE